ncbi:hypothetical protein PALI_a1635 [Pseudoalteromonas aliena SW19]|uniref:Uncharacterized protein n=1 Tax=Pseudoalteromonas aliena SW19 TaxID=1314866 RepID=A0ABR9DVI0_9GAMM|nr:hypothetical protein [Pseudoalteromonas aliena SW19]
MKPSYVIAHLKIEKLAGRYSLCAPVQLISTDFTASEQPIQKQKSPAFSCRAFKICCSNHY